MQGEYVEFSIVPTTQGPHKFQAVDVSGIKGGQLMCETRRELKVARNNYHNDRQEESQTPTLTSRKRVLQSTDNNTPRSRDSRKPKVRGEGPREGGEWTYVVKNNKAPSTKTRELKQEKV